MDGSSRQCLSALLDVIEDFREGDDPKAELVVTSYDIRKAFDTVQHYTIRASCERLNMPEAFIKYVLASLDGARSRVRCQDGLTEPFDILSSVRQGDPLAALVFIFVMDGLHHGLERHGEGYTFMDDGTTVHSFGYSDDTAAVSATWEGAC